MLVETWSDYWRKHTGIRWNEFILALKVELTSKLAQTIIPADGMGYRYAPAHAAAEFDVMVRHDVAQLSVFR